MNDLEQEWAQAPEDPHPRSDLEYQCLDISVVKAEHYGRLLLLPEDESLLKDDAFIVVGEDDLAELKEWA